MGVLEYVGEYMPMMVCVQCHHNSGYNLVYNVVQRWGTLGLMSGTGLVLSSCRCC